MASSSSLPQDSLLAMLAAHRAPPTRSPIKSTLSDEPLPAWINALRLRLADETAAHVPPAALSPPSTNESGDLELRDQASLQTIHSYLTMLQDCHSELAAFLRDNVDAADSGTSIQVPLSLQPDFIAFMDELRRFHDQLSDPVD